MAVADTIASSQKQTIDMMTSFTAKVVDIHRELAGTVLGQVPAAAAPVIAKLWDQTLVDQAFGFTGQLLDVNRAFVTDLFAVWTPEVKPAKK